MSDLYSDRLDRYERARQALTETRGMPLQERARALQGKLGGGAAPAYPTDPYAAPSSSEPERDLRAEFAAMPPRTVSVPVTAEEELSFVDNIWRSLGRGKDRMDIAVANFAYDAGFLDEEGLIDWYAENLAELQDNLPDEETAQNMAKVIDLFDTATFEGFIDALWENPGALANIMAESGYSMLAPILGGAVGGVLGGGLPGVSAGVGLGSSAVTYASNFTELLSEEVANRGGDPNNPNDIISVFEDKEAVAHMRETAATYGLTVGAVDALSVLLVGKFAAAGVLASRAPGVRQVTGKLSGTAVGAALGTVGKGAAELTGQAGMAGFGEYAGRKASGQPVSASEWILEALADFFFGAPAEIATAKGAVSKQKRAKLTKRYDALVKAVAEDAGVDPTDKAAVGAYVESPEGVAAMRARAEEFKVTPSYIDKVASNLAADLASGAPGAVQKGAQQEEEQEVVAEPPPVAKEPAPVEDKWDTPPTVGEGVAETPVPGVAAVKTEFVGEAPVGKPSEEVEPGTLEKQVAGIAREILAEGREAGEGKPAEEFTKSVDAELARPAVQSVFSDWITGVPASLPKATLDKLKALTQEAEPVVIQKILEKVNAQEKKLGRLLDEAEKAKIQRGMIKSGELSEALSDTFGTRVRELIGEGEPEVEAKPAPARSGEFSYRRAVGEAMRNLRAKTQEGALYRARKDYMAARKQQAKLANENLKKVNEQFKGVKGTKKAQAALKEARTKVAEAKKLPKWERLSKARRDQLTTEAFRKLWAKNKAEQGPAILRGLRGLPSTEVKTPQVTPEGVDEGVKTAAQRTREKRELKEYQEEELARKETEVQEAAAERLGIAPTEKQVAEAEKAVEKAKTAEVSPASAPGRRLAAARKRVAEAETELRAAQEDVAAERKLVADLQKVIKSKKAKAADKQAAVRRLPGRTKFVESAVLTEMAAKAKLRKAKKELEDVEATAERPAELVTAERKLAKLQKRKTVADAITRMLREGVPPSDIISKVAKKVADFRVAFAEAKAKKRGGAAVWVSNQEITRMQKAAEKTAAGANNFWTGTELHQWLKSLGVEFGGETGSSDLPVEINRLGNFWIRRASGRIDYAVRMGKTLQTLRQIEAADQILSNLDAKIKPGKEKAALTAPVETLTEAEQIAQAEIDREAELEKADANTKDATGKIFNEAAEDIEAETAEAAEPNRAEGWSSWILVGAQTLSRYAREARRTFHKYSNNQSEMVSAAIVPEDGKFVYYHTFQPINEYGPDRVKVGTFDSQEEAMAATNLLVTPVKKEQRKAHLLEKRVISKDDLQGLNKQQEEKFITEQYRRYVGTFGPVPEHMGRLKDPADNRLTLAASKRGIDPKGINRTVIRKLEAQQKLMRAPLVEVEAELNAAKNKLEHAKKLKDPKAISKARSEYEKASAAFQRVFDGVKRQQAARQARRPELTAEERVAAREGLLHRRFHVVDPGSNLDERTLGPTQQEKSSPEAKPRTVAEAIVQAIRNSSSNARKTTLRKLAALGRIQDIPVTYAPARNMPVQDGKSVRGVFRHGENGGPREIVINENQSNADRAAAFDHELMHAATHEAIDNDRNLQAVLTSMAERAAVLSNRQYNFLDPHEFVAEAFSNLRFQRWLKQQKPSADYNTSLWTKFKNVILKSLRSLGVNVRRSMWDDLVGLEPVLMPEEVAPTKPWVRKRDEFYLSTSLSSMKYGAPFALKAAKGWLRRKVGLNLMMFNQITETYAADFQKPDGSNPLKEYSTLDELKQGEVHEGVIADREHISTIEESARADGKGFAKFEDLINYVNKWQVNAKEAAKNPQAPPPEVNATAWARAGKMYNDLAKNTNRPWQKHYDAHRQYFRDAWDQQMHWLKVNVLQAWNVPEVVAEQYADQLKTKKDLQNLQSQLGLSDKDLESMYRGFFREFFGRKRIQEYFPQVRYGNNVVTAYSTETLPPMTPQQFDAWLADNPQAKKLEEQQIPGTNQFDYEVSHREFHFFEKRIEAEQARQRMIDSGLYKVKGKDEHTVSLVGTKLQNKVWEGTSASTMLRQAQDKFSGDPRILNAFRETLIMMMPETSLRKNELNRQNVVGFSTDPMRVFGDYAPRRRYYEAQLKYGRKLGDALRDMKDWAKYVQEGKAYAKSEKTDATKVGDVVNQFVKKDEADASYLEDPLWSRILTGVGYAWMLVGPSYWMVNATQPAMVTYPYLSAKFGTLKTTGAMMSAYKSIGIMGEAVRSAKAGFGLTWRGQEDLFQSFDAVTTRLRKNGQTEEADLLDWLAARGKIDNGLSMNMDDIAQNMTGRSPVRWFMQMGRAMPHLAEVINRSVTGIAAYKLARDAGRSVEQAQEAARLAIDETQFNYSAANRSWFMSRIGPLGAAAAPIFLFKTYAQFMYMLLARSTMKFVTGKGGSRAEGIKTLLGLAVTHSFAAGLLGGFAMEPVRILGMVLNEAMSDEDEPWDWEHELNKAVFDMFYEEGVTSREDAQAWTNYLLYGIAPLHSRVGLQNLFFMGFEGRNAEEAYTNAILQGLGPLGGLGLNFSRGIRAVQEGNLSKAPSYFAPKFIRDFYKGVYLYPQEGLRSWSDEIYRHPDDIDWVDQMVQTIGFTPPNIARTYRVRAAASEINRNVTTRRTALMRDFYQAVRDKDKRGRVDAVAAIRKWNQAYKGTGWVIRSKDLKSSLKSRFKRQFMLDRSRLPTVTSRKNQRSLEREVPY